MDYPAHPAAPRSCLSCILIGVFYKISLAPPIIRAIHPVL